MSGERRSEEWERLARRSEAEARERARIRDTAGLDAWRRQADDYRRRAEDARQVEADTGGRRW